VSVSVSVGLVSIKPKKKREEKERREGSLLDLDGTADKGQCQYCDER
jgi:hypothetical protein